jgi:chromosome segregation ATPase
MSLAKKALIPYFNFNFDQCFDEHDELKRKVKQVSKIRDKLEEMDDVLYDVEDYCCQAKNAVQSLHQFQDDIRRLRRSIKSEIKDVREELDEWR